MALFSIIWKKWPNHTFINLWWKRWNWWCSNVYMNKSMTVAYCLSENKFHEGYNSAGTPADQQVSPTHHATNTIQCFIAPIFQYQISWFSILGKFSWLFQCDQYFLTFPQLENVLPRFFPLYSFVLCEPRQPNGYRFHIVIGWWGMYDWRAIIKIQTRKP